MKTALKTWFHPSSFNNSKPCSFLYVWLLECTVLYKVFKYAFIVLYFVSQSKILMHWSHSNKRRKLKSVWPFKFYFIKLQTMAIRLPVSGICLHHWNWKTSLLLSYWTARMIMAEQHDGSFPTEMTTVQVWSWATAWSHCSQQSFNQLSITVHFLHHWEYK